MGDMRFPSPVEVKGVFKDVYTLYLKWDAVKEVDWDLLINESRDLEEKYPFDLNRKMIVEVVNVMEQKHMSAGKEN